MMGLRCQIDVIKKKNEALIYNILPAHVAKDFIGMKRRDDVRCFLWIQSFKKTEPWYDHWTGTKHKLL